MGIKTILTGGLLVVTGLMYSMMDLTVHNSFREGLKFKVQETADKDKNGIFATEVFSEQQIATVELGIDVTYPGVDFGSNAEGYIRFSYSNSIENIREGMRRIEEFLDKT